LNRVILFNNYITSTPIEKSHISICEKNNIEYIGDDCTTESDLIGKAKNADIIFFQGHVKMSKKVIDSLPNLKFIQVRGIGCNSVDLKTAATSNIPVSNLPGFCSDEVSTHAIALLLSFMRRIPENDKLLKQGKWDKIGFGFNGLDTLKAESIGIVGYGSIGRLISKKLSCFGAEILVHDPSIEEGSKNNIKFTSLNNLLGSCKYIILACPLSKSTEHMIDKEEFDLMKNDAILINIARGKLINEKALIDSLKEKRIGGAALDVFEKEPISDNDPLLKLKNVILSPHNAGQSKKSYELSLKMSFNEIIRFVSGKKLQYRVN